MRTELRVLAVRCALGGAALGLGLTGLVGWGLLWMQQDRTQRGLGALPLWVLVLAFVAVAAIVLTVPVLVGRAVADHRARRLTGPLRGLAQRAEEFGSSGFLAESLADTPAAGGLPLRTGIGEIDTVARILERNHRSLERALSAERSFAADASHQLRTPLAALLLRLEEITTAEEIPTIRHEAEIAIAQTERLAAVVDDLLHRTRAGHADGGRSVSLDTVLTQVQQEWEGVLAGQGRSITVALERGMIVRSSASAISQILDTLVDNSFIHGAGTVSIQARRHGPSAVIEVRDEGPGIPEHLARRVFDRAVTGGAGTGIGLAVARETAESFGGKLELVQGYPVVFALYVSMAPARSAG